MSRHADGLSPAGISGQNTSILSQLNKEPGIGVRVDQSHLLPSENVVKRNGIVSAN